MSGIEKRADFNFIRYANCWEDADILIKALDVKKEANFISIASSGDNTMALLLKDPKLVVAVDLNPAQLACLELRIAAFTAFEYKDVLKFLGIEKDENRLEAYERLKPLLSEESQSFWSKNLYYIKNGIIHTGKFENYFSIFRKYVLPLIHKAKTRQELVMKKGKEAQKDFYYNKWNNKRWRLLFRLFFSRTVMGKMGRDPEFFKYVHDDVAKNILKRVEHALTSINTYENPYLNYILSGNFPNHALPLYLREENFNKIRSRLDSIKIFKGDIKSCLEHYKEVKFDALNLSDIFEYMSQEEYMDTINLISNHMPQGGRIAFWNMLADRTIGEGLPFEYKPGLSKELFLEDKAFFYKRFVVAEKV
ncbi:MAG: DUF3419 family protein [Bacillota bacterium]